MTDKSPDKHDLPRQPHISVSKYMSQRFAESVRIRRIAALLFVVLTSIYLAWRLTIINTDSLFLSLTYYIAECFGFVLGLTVIFGSWSYHHRDPPPAPPGLDVDVFVLTYKETIEVIRRTVTAASKITYPHRTVILDDGRRDEIRELAELLGVSYLSRAENTDAKAGNLNFGLANSKAEYIACFDADHIAQPHALDTMLGFFEDKNVAMVQTPQDYFNTDAFQYMNPRRKAGLWHDQSFFYNIVQPCNDTNNAATCVGTGVIYRRSALDAIGGIPSETVTEDIHTSLKMHKLGFTTVYLNEPIAFGIAAADLSDYYKTRHRWAHGNLDAMRIENILFCKELNLRQRLAYLSLGLVYLEGWQQLMLILVPILTLSFGLAPFEITIFNVLVVLSFPILTIILLQELGCGFTRIWTNEIYAMSRWPIHIVSTFGLLGRKLAWKTSLKNIKGQVSLKLMMPQIIVLCLSLLAVSYAAWRLSMDLQIGPLGQFFIALITGSLDTTQIDIFGPMPKGYSVELVVVAGFWALFNATRATWFIKKAIDNARHSSEFFRFSLPLPVEIIGHDDALGCADFVAEDRIRVRFPDSVKLEDMATEASINLTLPSGAIQTKVKFDQKQKNSFEGELLWSDSEARNRLAASLYSINWQREFQTNIAHYFTLSDTMLAIIGRGRSEPPPASAWQPLLVNDKFPQEPAFLALTTVPQSAEQEVALISFKELQCGELYSARQHGNESDSHRKFRVTSEEPISTLPGKGLDGAIYRRYKVIYEDSDT